MPVHRTAEDKMCRYFGGATWLEVLGVHAGRYRRSADPGAKLRQPLFVIVRDRNGQVRSPAGVRLACAHLPPLHLEERALPRAALEMREALPDQVFDVVLEEQHGHVARHPDVHGGEQEVGDNQIDIALRERRPHLAADVANAPLPQIHGVVREPGARNRGGKRRTAALGNRVRHRDDPLAVRELLFQSVGIVTLAMRGDDGDLVTARELGNRVQAADAAASCCWPQAAHLHPQDSHTDGG